MARALIRSFTFGAEIDSGGVTLWSGLLLPRGVSLVGSKRTPYNAAPPKGMQQNSLWYPAMNQLHTIML
jgi:hypothetical protein